MRWPEGVGWSLVSSGLHPADRSLWWRSKARDSALRGEKGQMHCSETRPLHPIQYPVCLQLAQQVLNGEVEWNGIDGREAEDVEDESHSSQHRQVSLRRTESSEMPGLLALGPHVSLFARWTYQPMPAAPRNKAFCFAKHFKHEVYSCPCPHFHARSVCVCP